MSELRKTLIITFVIVYILLSPILHRIGVTVTPDAETNAEYREFRYIDGDGIEHICYGIPTFFPDGDSE